MRINLGSENPIKVSAVKEVIALYDFLSGSEVIPVGVDSTVSSQPKSMDETIAGATNRAKSAFKGCDYSIGLESGLMKVAQARSGYMDFTACIIYDGKKTYLGLSCAFEFPSEITRLIHEQGLDANEASFEVGLTKHKNIGSLEGAIGVLTKGRVTRKEYTKQAVQMALIQLENPSFYR